MAEPELRGRVVVDPHHPDLETTDHLGAALRGGSLVAFPTETVYGLGAAIGRADALARVFVVKGRPPTDPLIVHVADRDQLDGIVRDLPPSAVALADAFWPGPLTMVLPRGPLVPDAVVAGGDAVGVRIPAHPVALALLRAAATGIAAPSANRFGRISPTEADHVVEDLGDRLGSDDVVLDGGPTPLGIESTVVDLSAPVPTVLRHGGVPVEDLVAVVGEVAATERRVVAEGTATTSPGALLRHYAPETPLVLLEGDAGLPGRLVERMGEHGVWASVLDLPADPRAAANLLYRRLRAADRSGADVLLASVLEPDGLGRGVNDRLFRAAHGRVVLDDGPETMRRLLALR